MRKESDRTTIIQNFIAFCAVEWFLTLQLIGMVSLQTTFSQLAASLLHDWGNRLNHNDEKRTSSISLKNSFNEQKRLTSTDEYLK